MIHSSAIIATSAKLGKDEHIGPFSIIHDNVEIGDNSIVESYCELGYPTPLAGNRQLVIGQNSLIRSHSIFYQGSVFGEGLKTGHHVTVRENVKAGNGLQLGTLNDLQGDCVIGEYVRTHSNVHIGKKSKIGNYVWIFPYVVLTNDPHPPSNVLRGVTVEDFAVIATMSVILPGVTVGTGSLIAAHSSVSKDVEAGMVVRGAPAKPVCKTSDIKLKDGTNRVAYPWTSHFHRGYPQNIVDTWKSNEIPL